MESCPHCDAEVADGAGFCRACGWDVELMVADWRGEGTELPEDLDDEDYARILAREGLGGSPFPWLPALLAVGVVVAVLLAGLAR